MNASIINTDNLHRTAKVLLDTGSAGDIAAAYEKLASFRLSIHISHEAAVTRAGQAAVMTAVNAGVRALMGGVFVQGALDAPLLVSIPGARTLGDAVIALGGTAGKSAPAGTPALVVGGGKRPVEAPHVLRTVLDGWSGGVVPFDTSTTDGLGDNPLAGVAAGALAVSETFLWHTGLSGVALHRPTGISLWEPSATWESATSGPKIEVLPSQLWMVGLGHLGQANLWTLGLMPYVSPGEVVIYLQDYDEATEANCSTSPLTFARDIKRRKTRIAADWAEQAGFKTYLVERRFDGTQRRRADEPSLALFGVDHPLPRSQAEEAGFERIIDAGLGAGASDFMAYQVNTLPGPESAKNIWGSHTMPDIPVQADLAPAYRELAEQARSEGKDPCGVVRLAGVAVGASFVGLFTSALVVAEAVRLVMGGPMTTLIDGNLTDPDARAVVQHGRPLTGLGFTDAYL